MAEGGVTRDKRKYPRTPVAFSCIIRRVLPDGGEAPHEMVRTLNIGPGGMLIECGIELAAGDAMRMIIMMGERRFEARGRVVFVKRDSGGPARYGVEFTEIDADDRDMLVANHLARELGLGG